MMKKLLVVASLLVPSVAHADGKSPIAEALFREGLTLFDAGKFHEACDKFAESYKLDSANGTLQNLATCHEKDGRTATAWSEWTSLASLAERAKQTARQDLAKKKAAALEPKLTKLRLNAKPDSNVDEIVFDGAPLGKSAWSTLIPIDRGAHTIKFAAASKVAIEKSLDAPDGPATVDIEIPHLVDVPVAMAPKTVAPEPKPLEPPPPPQGSSTLRTVGFVVGGVGVISLGVGAYFGIRTFSKKSDGDKECNAANQCSDTGLDLQDQASKSALISTVTIAVGAAAVAGGVYLILSNPSEPSRFAVAPTLNGAVLFGRF